MDNHLDLLHFTLDLLILNAAALGPLHGHDCNRMPDVIAGILRTPSEEV
jgi:hypothetical protein